MSHLPHVLANVLVSQAARALDEQGEALPRVGPSFRDATRVAGANTEIWTDIYLSNAESIAAEVDETVRRLEEVAAALRAGDADAVIATGTRRRATTGGGCSRRTWPAGRCTSCASRCRTARVSWPSSRWRSGARA